jgi:hypothetical protein
MNLFNRMAQNVATAKKTMPATTKSGFFNKVAQNVATAKKTMPATTKSGFFNKVAQNVATVKQAMPAQAKSSFFSNIAKNVATAKQAMPAQAKSSFFSNIAKNIATSKPIPAPVKQSLIKTIQQGKQLPAVIKKALAVKKMVRQSMPQMPIKKPITSVRQAMPAPVTRPINPTMPRNSVITKISTLLKNTNPSIVQKATPIQRSYMPIDLPYQTVNQLNYGIKIPATNFALPTDIDLVQPSVDGGTFDYYGK